MKFQSKKESHNGSLNSEYHKTVCTISKSSSVSQLNLQSDDDSLEISSLTKNRVFLYFFSLHPSFYTY